MRIIDLRALLQHELEDLFSAEVQLIEALPKMATKATDRQLTKAFRDHLKITKEHKKRLGKIRQLLGSEKSSPENKGFFAKLFSSNEGETHCKAMEGLLKEADHLMSEDMCDEVLDAALIAAAQKIEHYEISSYGTARAYALQLGEKEVAKLLGQTLEEEYAADDSLTKLALGSINANAEDEIEARIRNTYSSPLAGSEPDLDDIEITHGSSKKRPKKSTTKAVPKSPVKKKRVKTTAKKK